MELSSTIDIGGRRFKNRAVMAPMVSNLANPDGSVGSDYLNFYQRRAEGGPGFIILGGVYVHVDGRGFNAQLGIHDDRMIPGLELLVQSLRPNCRIGVQLSFKSKDKRPSQFSLNEIFTYRRAFVNSAKRAEACGFDAVELHACHDYWLNYFLSPHFNRREDRYGGDLENRYRLLGETVAAIRDAIGGALLIGVRLSVEEFVHDGLTLLETKDVAGWLQAAGVDYLSASGGIGETQYRMSPPMEVARGSLLPLCRSIISAVSIPVIGVGRLDRPTVFRTAVREGSADLAAAGRAMIADPDYVAKTLAGRDTEIRPCVACNFCLLRLHRGQPLRCAVNPGVGREGERLRPLERKLRAAVVGGGPAGLSFAVRAALRGARVTLFEKRSRLGGVILEGQRPPHKAVLQDFVEYLEKSARDAGVEIRTGQEAHHDLLVDLSADITVIATGAAGITLPLPELGDQVRVFTAERLLSLEVLPSGRYLVVGGGAVGLEIADLLANHCMAVTLIEMTESLGQGMHATRLKLILERLSAADVCILTGTRLAGAEGDHVIVEREGEGRSIGPFDMIVFAVGSRSNRSVADQLPHGFRLVVIGDAKQPRSIFEAVSEGHEAAERLPVEASDET